jgi:endonuclease/exonuclease/phosphatase family metal-dependent hydrolase
MKLPCLTGLAAAAALCLPLSSSAEEFTVVTYNVENLFDADGTAIFDDYKETGGEHAYSPAKLLVKLQNVAKVLKTFNNGAGPDVVALNELEIDFTPESGAPDHAAVLDKYRGTTVARMLTTELDDEIRGLPVEVLLLKQLEDEGMGGYRVAVGEDKPDLEAVGGSDRRVHRKAHKNAVFSKFPITETKSHPTPDARDILEVTLDVRGHPLTLFVNHWKSGAGDFAAEQTRRLNAQTLRARLEAILAADPASDIIVTGDFNSQYNQSKVNPHLGKTAVNDVLGSQGDEASTASAQSLSLYNLWHELPPDRRFSDHYDGHWGTLMQTMLAPGLYDYRGVQYADNSFQAVVLDKVNTAGPLKLPRRWTNAGRGDGYSDHFPISARFRTVGDGDAARCIELTGPGTEDAPAEPIQTGIGQIDAKAVGKFDAAYADEPAGHIGQLFRVSGKIVSLRPVTIAAGGREFLLYSHDDNLRRKLRSYPKGGRLEFVGEFALHRGKLQFIVEQDDWILKAPKTQTD